MGARSKSRQLERIGRVWKDASRPTFRSCQVGLESSKRALLAKLGSTALRGPIRTPRADDRATEREPSRAAEREPAWRYTFLHVRRARARPRMAHELCGLRSAAALSREREVGRGGAATAVGPPPLARVQPASGHRFLRARVRVRLHYTRCGVQLLSTARPAVAAALAPRTDGGGRGDAAPVAALAALLRLRPCIRLLRHRLTGHAPHDADAAARQPVAVRHCRRYKARAGTGCQLAVPYGANPHGVAQYEAAPEAARPLLVSFSGSLDVCCSGQKIRCAVGDVMVAAHDHSTRQT